MPYNQLLNACYTLKECSKEDFPSNGTKYVLGVPNAMEYHQVPDVSTETYIFENNDKVLIVITGTKDFDDLLVDLRIQEEEDSVIGTAHEGFLTSCNHIHEYIQNNITFGGRETIIIGHSLGGAVGKLLSMKLRIDRVMTLGEPNSCKKKRIVEGTEYIRVINNSDIVSRIAFFYNHGIKDKHETVIYLDRNGKAIINPSRRKVWKDILIGKILVIFGKERAFDAFRDHTLNSYIHRLSDVVKAHR